MTATYHTDQGLGFSIDGEPVGITGAVIDQFEATTIGLMAFLDTGHPGPPKAGWLRVSAGDEVLYEGHCELRCRVTTAPLEDIIREAWVYQDGDDEASAGAMVRVLRSAERERDRRASSRSQADRLTRTVEAQGHMLRSAIAAVVARPGPARDGLGLSLAAVLGALAGFLAWFVASWRGW